MNAASKSISIIFLVSAVGGCATPMIFDKASGTQAEYNKDSYECERDARQSGYFGGGIFGSMNMKEFFKSCMVARGYTLRE